MNVVIDSCFWFSYLQNRSNDNHEEAVKIFDFLDKVGAVFIVPFPSLYETLNTRLLKLGHKLEAEWFKEKLEKDSRFIIVYDDKYREVAFKDTISNQNDRGISLVDNIIRVMLKDGSHKIKALVTFNSKDFEDVCYEEGIELINESFSSDTLL